MTPDGKDAAITPESAFNLLKAGNARFLTGATVERDLVSEVKATSNGAKPFAVVLTCCDARTPPEMIFDQGLGSIFSVRVAGNVLSRDGLGTMEFACQLGGAKLVVVMGHSSCVAIKTACEGLKLENLTRLLAKLSKAIRQVEKSGIERKGEFQNLVAAQNVKNVVASIQKNSETLQSMIKDGQIGIVGGMYSVQTGAVHFGDLFCGDSSSKS